MEADDIERQSAPFKRAKLNNGKSSPMPGGRGGQAPPATNSFAARMMAKMGYVEGQGLGTTGKGRLAPIEVQLRPSGAGLGAVKEKTRQAKEEEKREKAFRGEVLEDSEEEEKKRWKELKKKRMSTGIGGSGTSTPRGKPKVKYKTAAEGLEIPNVLKSLVDLTGKETTLAASGIALPGSTDNTTPINAESIKIANRARMELDALVDEWNHLSERKKYFDHQSSEVVGELDNDQQEVESLQKLIEGVQFVSQADMGATDVEARWVAVISRLFEIYNTFGSKAKDYSIHDVAIAAIQPVFKDSLLQWDCLSNPSFMVNHLTELGPLLNINPSNSHDANGTIARDEDKNETQQRRNTKSTTSYETLIYTLWLPHVRNQVRSTSDIHNPQPLLSLIQAWENLLPKFVLSALLNQDIIPKLEIAIANFRPTSSLSSSSKSDLLPHLWIFPWLPLLPSRHTSPISQTGLIHTLRSRFRSILSTWPLPSGPPPFLLPFRELLTAPGLTSLLTRTILPRLASHLHKHLEVKPEDQDISPIETLALWTPLFPPHTVAQLLLVEFFPKFHYTLWEGLTSEGNYEEIGQWLVWWREQIGNLRCSEKIPAPIPDPADEEEEEEAMDEANGPKQEVQLEEDSIEEEKEGTTNDLPPIEAQWLQAYTTIHTAIEIGPSEAATSLPKPAAGPARPVVLPSKFTSTSTSATHHSSSTANTTNPTTASSAHHHHHNHNHHHHHPQEISFKDVVTSWCEESSLWMRPLGEAHPEFGAPLYRITGSATGKGGVVCFVRGDVLFVRKKKGKIDAGASAGAGVSGANGGTDRKGGGVGMGGTGLGGTGGGGWEYVPIGLGEELLGLAEK
ncbi:hypothetical protein MMC25_008144 [Agyrium rufum]|nr:hypothetical protein [Agyrium rufum]